MTTTRRIFLAATGLGLITPQALRAEAREITVAYAGSMGVLMDRGLGPSFTRKTGITTHGIGEASMALAHLLAAKTLIADVFISVSSAPIKVLETAGLIDRTSPIARTGMVIAYSPKSRFAKKFEGNNPKQAFEVLAAPGLRFGRTDPATDPQGQYCLYTLLLAERLYNQPALLQNIAGSYDNPAEIFAEPSLLARLQDGELDATIAYESAVKSQKLPFVSLPDEINLSNPAMKTSWYDKAAMMFPGAKAAKSPSPLVFYAGIMKNAPHAEDAAEFMTFLTSPIGQRILGQFGYKSTPVPSV